MKLWKRFVKLCQADLHGALDRIEDRGLLLRQHLRDMTEALDAKGNTFRALAQSEGDTGRELEETDRELEKLEENLSLALSRNRDDLARGLIDRRLSLSRHRVELARRHDHLEQEVRALRDLLDRQRLIFDDLRLRAADYLREQDRPAWSSPAVIAAERGSAAEFRAAEVDLELLRAKAALKGGD